MFGPFGAALSLGSELFSGIAGFKGGRSAASTPIGIGPAFSRISGQLALNEALGQSQLQLDQSNVAFEEGRRAEALRKAEITSFKESQANAFAGSGLAVSGSALGVLEETKQLGYQELAAIHRSTDARSRVLEEDGLRILRSGYAQRFSSNIEAQQSEFDYENKQRELAAQGNLAGAKGLFAGVGLAGLGVQKYGTKIKSWFSTP